MASLQWTIMFALVVLEVSVLFFLLLPILPSRFKYSIVNFFTSLSIFSHASPIKFAFYIVGVGLFLESVRQLRKYQIQAVDVQLQTDYRMHESHQATLFHAQRNLYLSFFSLFLLFVIERVIALLSSQVHSDKMLEVLKKQSEQNLKEYNRLVEEKEAIHKDWKTGQSGFEESEKEKKKAQQLLKQQNNHQTSFVELVEKNTTLENENKELSTRLQKVKTTLDKVSSEKKILEGVVRDYEESSTKKSS